MKREQIERKVTEKAYRTGRDALSSTEVQIVLDHCKTDEEHCVIGVGLAAGLRREDVIWIERDKVVEDTDAYDPQTGPLVRISYWEHKKRRTWEALIAGEVAQAIIRFRNQNKHSQWLFPSNRKGKHISSRHAYDVFQRVLDRSKLRRRPFHALRATCIKQCQRAGWAVNQTAELVGDTEQVIRRHYLTPSDDEMKEVVRIQPPIHDVRIGNLRRSLKERPIGPVEQDGRG